MKDKQDHRGGTSFLKSSCYHLNVVVKDIIEIDFLVCIILGYAVSKFPLLCLIKNMDKNLISLDN